MRLSLNKVLLFAVSFLTWGALAQATCTEAHWTSGKTEVIVSKYNDGTCGIQVQPVWTLSLLYRNYQFDSTGFMMVFESYGAGPENTHTAARDFYMFPWTHEISIEKAANNDVIVHLVNGDTLTIDSETSQLKKSAMGTVIVASQISATDQGGVIFKNYRGLMLNVGFAIGHDPAGDLKSQMTFTDAKGTQCQVIGNELFSLVNNNPILTAKNDLGIKAWLKNRCPQINPGY